MPLEFGTKTMVAAAVAMLLSAASATAQPAPSNTWLQNGIAMKGALNTASAGGFGVMQIATTDPEHFMADWNKPGDFVKVDLATATVRHRPIVTFLLFTGCRPDAAGNCDVTADYEMTDPTGKRYDLSRNSKVWVLPPPLGRALQLSADGYGSSFEDKDALGSYRVRATITDHVAGLTLHTEQTLVVSAK